MSHQARQPDPAVQLSGGAPAAGFLRTPGECLPPPPAAAHPDTLRKLPARATGHNSPPPDPGLPLKTRPLPSVLQRSVDTLRLCLGLGGLGVICLLWTPFALILSPLLTQRAGARLGRYAIMRGFRLYLGWLGLLRACRFDLAELAALREAGPLILAPNHPCLLDAVMVLASLPDVACVMKADLMRNPLLGAGARLARFIRNDTPLAMVHAAVDNLHQGSQLLFFPEGTRTTRWPINPCLASVGLIASRAKIPVQTLIVETDSLYLSKGWPLLRPPAMPIRYRIRLGVRFDPPPNVAAFTKELESYFREQLPPGAPGQDEQG